jgi:hypothetical protein
MFLGKAFGILADLVAQGLGKLSVVENPNLVLRQIASHSLGIAKGMQTACQNNTIKAIEYAVQLVMELVRQELRVCENNLQLLDSGADKSALRTADMTLIYFRVLSSSGLGFSG